MRTYYAAHFVEQPGPGYGVRVVLAADVARLHAAAREVIADWDRNPEFEPVSGPALREALNGGETK